MSVKTNPVPAILFKLNNACPQSAGFILSGWVNVSARNKYVDDSFNITGRKITFTTQEELAKSSKDAEEVPMLLSLEVAQGVVSPNKRFVQVNIRYTAVSSASPSKTPPGWSKQYKYFLESGDLVLKEEHKILE